ncbi:uncharacterized protein LOC133993284 isoform X2 [Scomber scombrus]|uniref:uncharacterized protein LOC133993284 isoform X2 n=1 Tax=Scomber scombrus TaxID=13677 RepID=UPI002DDB3933|nr:uncharacterized protein LOC133993284 isoform X2 [Scomber scombrus]
MAVSKLKTTWHVMLMKSYSQTHNEVPQCPTVPPSHAPHTAASTHKPIGVNHECPFLLIIIPTAAISMLVTTIFTLLIIPRVKLWICSRMTRSTLPVSGDYVYETMSKNGLQRLAVAEHPLDSPYGIIA